MVTTLKDLKDLRAESGWALPWAQGRTARAADTKSGSAEPRTPGPALTALQGPHGGLAAARPRGQSGKPVGFREEQNHMATEVLLGSEMIKNLFH